jgi:hypothetical protein
MQVRDVKDLILSAHNPALRAASNKKFLFDIVANGINGIDVDKCAPCSKRALCYFRPSVTPVPSLACWMEGCSGADAVLLAADLTTWRVMLCTVVSRSAATLIASCASRRCTPRHPPWTRAKCVMFV